MELRWGDSFLEKRVLLSLLEAILADGLLGMAFLFGLLERVAAIRLSPAASNATWSSIFEADASFELC